MSNNKYSIIEYYIVIKISLKILNVIKMLKI